MLVFRFRSTNIKHDSDQPLFDMVNSFTRLMLCRPEARISGSSHFTTAVCRIQNTHHVFHFSIFFINADITAVAFPFR